MQISFDIAIKKIFILDVALGTIDFHDNTPPQAPFVAPSSIAARIIAMRTVFLTARPSLRELSVILVATMMIKMSNILVSNINDHHTAILAPDHVFASQFRREISSHIIIARSFCVRLMFISGDRFLLYRSSFL